MTRPLTGPLATPVSETPELTRTGRGLTKSLGSVEDIARMGKAHPLYRGAEG